MQDLSISERNQSSYREAYLDNAATTKPRPEVVQVMMRELRNYGNASSVHALGKEAKRVLEDSRAVIAAALGAESDGRNRIEQPCHSRFGHGARNRRGSNHNFCFGASFGNAIGARS